MHSGRDIWSGGDVCVERRVLLRREQPLECVRRIGGSVREIGASWVGTPLTCSVKLLPERLPMNIPVPTSMPSMLALPGPVVRPSQGVEPRGLEQESPIRQTLGGR